MAHFQIDFEPIGKRISVDEQTSLLVAAQDAGVSLSAVCGGLGLCQDCKIRCLSGKTSAVNSIEREVFSERELADGWRLACQVFPRSDLKIGIPPESMTTSQRLQIEGVLRDVVRMPAVTTQDFELTPPGLEDLRADWERFLETVPFEVRKEDSAALPVMAQFSSCMRQWGWSGRVALTQDRQVVGFLAGHQPPFGLAVDIGTTKLAAFLVNLDTGQTIVQKAVMNPQIAYGEDVLSRIAYANQSDAHRIALQRCLVDTLNQLMEEFSQEADIDTNQIVDFVIVGNTAIHHLFAGLAVRQLGQAPYVPALQSALCFPAREIGLFGAPGAWVYLPPIIAGFVGADHVAMLLATDLPSRSGVAVALDVGTNTEISLSKKGHLVSCSCASGPAFEGAHIHDGMRAAPGAIERAQFFAGDWHLATIDEEPPLGICGSGILDVVAALLESGQIDVTGRFTDQVFRRVNHGDALILVPGAASGTGKDILVTRSDIREVQLAKAAIRAGVEALLRATDTKVDEIDHFIVAGAFGTYLHVESAIQIGMFPHLPRDRYIQVGNAAGSGAREMLLSYPSREMVKSILAQTSYIELTTDPGFFESYVDFMGFDR